MCTKTPTSSVVVLASVVLLGRRARRRRPPRHRPRAPWQSMVVCDSISNVLLLVTISTVLHGGSWQCAAVRGSQWRGAQWQSMGADGDDDGGNRNGNGNRKAVPWHSKSVQCSACPSVAPGCPWEPMAVHCTPWQSIVVGGSPLNP